MSGSGSSLGVFPKNLSLVSCNSKEVFTDVDSVAPGWTPDIMDALLGVATGTTSASFTAAPSNFSTVSTVSSNLSVSSSKTFIKTALLNLLKNSCSLTSDTS